MNGRRFSCLVIVKAKKLHKRSASGFCNICIRYYFIVANRNWPVSVLSSTLYRTEQSEHWNKKPFFINKDSIDKFDSHKGSAYRDDIVAFVWTTEGENEIETNNSGCIFDEITQKAGLSTKSPDAREYLGL